jgi:small-conductance mechanosensitive channel
MLIVIITGFVLFASIWLIRNFLRFLIPDNLYRKNIQYILPLAEFVVWTLYVFWALHQLLSNRFYYQELVVILIVVLTLLFSWFILKDFLAGIIFKMEHNFRLHDRVRINNTYGNLKKLGYLTIQLENESGEFEIYSYSKISGQKIVRINAAGVYQKFELRIRISHNEPNLAQKIRNLVLNCSWSSPHHEPLVKIVEIADQGLEAQLAVFALNAEHAERIRQHLLKFTSEQVERILLSRIE